jgi:hypothetical protein
MSVLLQMHPLGSFARRWGGISEPRRELLSVCFVPSPVPLPEHPHIAGSPLPNTVASAKFNFKGADIRLMLV